MRGGGRLLSDIIYPIGSIYISVNPISPSVYFGGTWEQIKDQFLLSAGDTYKAGTTGGSATHTLTVDEIPAHNHPVGIRTKALWSGADAGQTWGDIARANGNNGQVEEKYNYCWSNNTGGGKAHNNMPPYLAVYVWKRTG